MAKEKENATVETKAPAESAPVEKPVAKPVAVAKDITRTVYVGPARPYGLALTNRAVLMDGAIVPNLDDAKKAHPVLAKLFVPLEKLAIARAALLRAGDPLRVAYDTVQKETLAMRQNNGGK